MEAAITDIDLFLAKAKAVAQGPDGEVLRRLVDILYERRETLEDEADQILTPEDLAAIAEGEEAIRRGEYISLEEFEKKHNL